MRRYIYLVLALCFYSDFSFSDEFFGSRSSAVSACSALVTSGQTYMCSDQSCPSGYIANFSGSRKFYYSCSSSEYCYNSTYAYSGKNNQCFTTKAAACSSNSQFLSGTECVNSCPSGTTANASSECVTNEVPNPCSAKSGQSGGFTKTGTVGDSFLSVSNGTAHYPSTAQVAGCAGTISDVKCNVGSGEDAVYACKGTIYYDGQKAPEGTTDNSTETEDTSSIADPESNSSSDQSCGDWSTAADGTQNRTCTTSSESSKEGQVNCGTFNGQFMCIGPSPTPEKDSVVKTDQIKQETLSNGNIKTTTTSTVNNTYCSGTVCSTTTTTTTTSVTKSGDTVVSTVTNCTGPNCPKPSDSTGGGGGGGGNENGGSFSGGAGCVESAGCTPDTNFLGDDEIPSIAETNQRIFESFENSPIGQALNSITWPSGGSCPTYSLSVFDSSITINQHCDMWAQVEGTLSAVFLGIWALAAVRIIMSA